MVSMRGLSLLFGLAALAVPAAFGQAAEHPASAPLLRGAKDQHHEDHVPQQGAETSDNSTGTAPESQQQLQKEQLAALKQRMRREAIIMLLGLIVQVVLTMVVGLLYAACPRHQPSPSEVLSAEHPGRGFRFGLCDGCCHSLRICCCSFWCLPIRWAETASSPKVDFLGCRGCSFLLALLLFEMLYVFCKLPAVFVLASDLTNPAVYGFWAAIALLFGLVLLTVQVAHRQLLRRRYGLEHGTCCTCTSDALSWCFCGCCAAMQEALQVDYVGEPVEIKEVQASRC